MSKVFNVTGSCIPERHYMVDITDRIEVIKKMVDAGKYITINRGRQYGKTTTLTALENSLSDQYYVLNMDFQIEMSSSKFKDENSFSCAFAKAFSFLMKNLSVNAELICALEDMKNELNASFELVDLFVHLNNICHVADKPIVLIIDEADSASNNQVFLDFLAQLRGAYLRRDRYAVFQSVILAGVHDIRNLQLKIRPESEHKHNSPWNIAEEFDADMSFGPDDIAGMLNEYESDHHTGMDVKTLSQLIYDYTSGYPVLVSMFCLINDEKTSEDAWTEKGISEAAKRILNEQSPLFGSLINKVEENTELRNMLYSILFKGEEYTFNYDDPVIGLAFMFGFITSDSGKVRIANRIFETRLYNYFLSVERTSNALAQDSSLHRNEYIIGDKLDMEKILERFTVVYNDIYGNQSEEFLEDAGRRLFLLFIRPIINGCGNYYIESQTRNQRRTDLIIDYKGEQYIIEMKIWHGSEYNERGEKQLSEYLDYYHLNRGYLLSFCFNKNKTPGTHTVSIGDKTLFEAIV